MKPQDLRIGNYVYYENTTHIISGIMGSKIYSWWVKDGKPVIEYEQKDIGGAQVENPYIDVISRHEPIPLTEEWLIKLGIEFKDKKHLYWVKGAFNLELTEEGDVYFEVYSHYIDVKYVHQLQNLYFALTGEELKQDNETNSDRMDT